MTNVIDQNLVQQAIFFVFKAHDGQYMKETPGGISFPYPAHVMSVFSEVQWAIHTQPVDDPTLALINALLHDVDEDTSFGHKVKDKFGLKYYTGMRAMSKDKTLPTKREQMEDSLKRILLEPREIGLGKMADRTVNLGQPPKEWTLEKSMAYRDEAILIRDTLYDCHPPMGERLTEKIDAYIQYL